MPFLLQIFEIFDKSEIMYAMSIKLHCEQLAFDLLH